MPTTKSPNASSPVSRSPNRDSTKQPLGAELWLKGQRPMPCTLTKLAHNHLIFISLNEVPEAPQQSAHEAAGKLIFLGDGKETPLCIPVRVNHHTRERWTLEPKPGALTQLVQLKHLMQAPPKDCETSTDRLNPYRRGELLRDCQSIIDDFFHARFARFFSELDDKLLRAAATDSVGQQTYQVAIDTAANRQEAFTADYLQRVLPLLAAAAEPDFTPVEPVFPPATTQSRGQTANLAQLTKQTSAQNQAVLDSLALHFSLIVQRLTETNALPFGPAWLYYQFGQTTEALAFPEESRHLLNQVFRDAVIGPIAPLYSRLDAMFSAQNSNTAGPENLPPVLQQAVPAPADATGRHHASAEAAKVTLPSPQPSHAEKLLRAASSLQHALSGQRVDDTHILGELCNRIIEDERVHDEARPLLRQIKAPLLSLATSDSEFWCDSQHPARGCFESIAILCRETWFRGGPVRRRLPSICERIQREWKSNPGLFATLMPLLEDLLTRQQQASKRNIQRLAAKLDGQQRLRQAQHDVSTQLRQRFEGQPFSTELQQLIDQGWHQYMVQILVNNGPRSSAYQHALTTLERLHDTLGDAPGSASSQALESSTPALLEELLKPLEAAGLANVQYQQALTRIDRLLRNPERKPTMAPDFRTEKPDNPAQAAAARYAAAGVRRGIDIDTAAKHIDSDSIPTLQPLQSQHSATSARDDEGSLPLSPGEWLGWIDCSGEHPMQLAWSAADGSRHAFIDQAGNHLFDLSDTELAADRRLGLQRMADPWENLPLEDELYQLLARHFTALSVRCDQHTASDLLGPNVFEAELAQYAKLAAYSGHTHTLIGVQFAPSVKNNNASAHHSGSELSANATADQPTPGEVARLLHRICPEDALLARLDLGKHTTGLYCAALLPYTDVATGQQQLQRVIEGLASLAGHTAPAGQPARSQCGLLMVTQHSSPPSILLKQLQEGCALASAADGQTSTSASPRSWIPQLGQILQQDRLKLRVQGSVATGENDRNHYEILLGVIDDHGQITLPGDLIAAAEHHQRMDIIDRWVIQHTFQWLEANPQKTRQLGCIHINLSANALQSNPFLAFLLAELERGSIPNDALSFEISETTASANLPRAADFIARVRFAGCHFTLDHFGKGPGSLELLRQLPIDMIKFDQALTVGLAQDKARQSLLSALNQAAHSLGVTTCAQGVEDEDILHTLETLNIDYAQGFGVAKPVALEDA